jgi:predicted deacylase
VLERQRRMARSFGLPIVWGTDPSLDGRSLSVARDANVPAIYVEYLGGAGCDPRASGVSALVRGCLNVLVDLGIVEGEVVLPLSPGEPIVVEDGRPNSGFLQIQHPAPRAGIFEPAVALGQPVRDGDILGAVSDVLGREIVPIASDRAGVVLVLHTVAPVARGEGVAVVLETDRRLPGWLPPEDSHARPAPSLRVS